MEAEAAVGLSRVACPSCGGAGGGPFGRAGSAWDDEEYVCPRCEGAGVIALHDIMTSANENDGDPDTQESGSASVRPGIVKVAPETAPPVVQSRPSQQKKRKASA